MLTSPLSPAVQLGADRILAISTRSNRTSEGVALPAEEGEDYPPPAQMIGPRDAAILATALASSRSPGTTGKGGVETISAEPMIAA